MFLELIRKLKAPICDLEFALSIKRVIGLIWTEKSCPMIVEINSNLIDGQTDPQHMILLVISAIYASGEFLGCAC